MGEEISAQTEVAEQEQTPAAEVQGAPASPPASQPTPQGQTGGIDLAKLYAGVDSLLASPHKPEPTPEQTKQLETAYLKAAPPQEAQQYIQWKQQQEQQNMVMETRKAQAKLHFARTGIPFEVLDKNDASPEQMLAAAMKYATEHIATAGQQQQPQGPRNPAPKVASAMSRPPQKATWANTDFNALRSKILNGEHVSASDLPED